MSSKDASGTPHEESHRTRRRENVAATGERPLMSFSLCRHARGNVAAARATQVKTWPHRAGAARVRAVRVSVRGLLRGEGNERAPLIAETLYGPRDTPL
jgi:hypothetical protein